MELEVECQQVYRRSLTNLLCLTDSLMKEINLLVEVLQENNKFLSILVLIAINHKPLRIHPREISKICLFRTMLLLEEQDRIWDRLELEDQ